MKLKELNFKNAGDSFIFLNDVVGKHDDVTISVYRIRNVTNYNNGTQVSVINLKSFQGDAFGRNDQLVLNREIRFVALPK